MGRHADPDRRAFRRSLAVAAGKALLVLALLSIATAAVAGLAGRPGDRDGSAAAFPEAPRLAGTLDGGAAHATPRAPAASPTPSASPPTPTPTPDVADAGSVQVQVLDGGGGADAAGEVAEVLAGYGYDVVAVNPARCCYETTTLFHSDGRQAEALALRDRDTRFAVVELNLRLDQDVDLHVVVGEDWSSR